MYWHHLTHGHQIDIDQFDEDHHHALQYFEVYDRIPTTSQTYLTLLLIVRSPRFFVLCFIFHLIDHPKCLCITGMTVQVH